MSPDTVSDWAKAGVAVVTLLTPVFIASRKLIARSKKRAEERRLESKAVRYVLDATRHILFHMPPSVHGDNSELARQKMLVDQVRDELWVFDGNESSRNAQMAVNAIVKAITRTQRIEAAKARQIRQAIAQRRLEDE